MKRAYNIQGLVLGDTELPLLLQDNDILGVQILDTTEVHIQKILAQLA